MARRKSGAVPGRRAVHRAATRLTPWWSSKNKKARRPILARCRDLLFGVKRCEFICVGTVRAAMLVEKADPNKYVIVHPSTKVAGKWQASYFDELGPVGDSERKSCSAALEDLSPRRWRLKDVK